MYEGGGGREGAQILPKGLTTTSPKYKDIHEGWQ